MYKFFFISFLLYFILVFQIPSFIGDEGYYSISITDAINNGIQPYLLFFNVPAFWKPPLMVNTYAIIAIPFIQLFNMDIVYAYRMGSIIFSAINVLLVFLISKEFIDKDKAKWITIIYMLNPIILIFGTKIFMETMAMTFVFTGILGAIKYTKENKNIWLTLIPISIFGASYTKSFTIGIMSILLCGLYFFLFNLKKIDKFIIATIMGIGLCILFAYYSGFPEQYYKLFIQDFFTSRMQNIYLDNLFGFISGIIYLIPLFFISFRTISLKNKNDLFMLLWILPLFLILIKSPFIWYSFYFIFPIIYIAMKNIEIKFLDLFIVVLLILFGLIITYYTFNEDKNIENSNIEQYIKENIKDECIFIIGAPEMTIYSYLYNNNYTFNFILKGGFDHVIEKKAIHYLSKNEVNNLIENYFENKLNCIEKQESLFLNLSGNYYRSCDLNCERPKYIFISSEPKTKIINCNFIKEIGNMNIWKC